MITFTDTLTKFKVISGTSNTTNVAQAAQDINIGYQRFNAAIARYFTRKQLFTDLVASQQYYQVPVDTIKVMTVTVMLSTGYQFPLAQIRDEEDWRKLNISPYTSSYVWNYFVLGNDQIGLYPIPSDTITNGLRFVYQPQDVDLTKSDYSTGTATVAIGATTVTGSGTAWDATMVGMQFQVTSGTDGNWYEVTSVTNSTTLVIKTPYAGVASASGATYRMGQVFIFPGEYDDVPVDYALARFFESRNNPARASYHKNKYDEAVRDAIEKYSSSSTSNVITGDYPSLNLWFAPPQPGV